MFQAAVISAGATISSTAAAPRGDQVGDRGDRRVDVGEVDPGGGRHRRLRDGLEDRLGDVGERPLRADQEAAEDLQRLVGVEEGAEAVAGRVLDLELAADAGGELGVGADLVADLREPRGELRLGLRERGGGARRGGVDPGPRGEDEGQRAQGRVAVLGDPAAHPARVVGDDAADRGDVGARRVGAEAAAVRGEDAVDVAEDRAGADPRRGAVLEHLDRAEVAADVDQDAVGLALAVEAGAAGAEGDRDAALAAEGEHLGDVASSFAITTASREEAVGAGVGGVADQVGGAAEDAVGAEQRLQLAAQRLGDPGGERVGRGPARVAGRRAERRGPRSRSERRPTGVRGSSRTARRGPCPAIGLEERHAGRDGDFDQLRLRGGERGLQGRGDAVAIGRPVGGDAVALGDGGDVELRQVEAGRAGDLLDFGEPFEDRVLLVAEDQEGDRDVVGDGAPEGGDRVLGRALAEDADDRPARARRAARRPMPRARSRGRPRR